MSDKAPKISIIVPVYRVEHYLPICIESILAQTFPDWELLLVNDGSPDNSGKICDEYARKDARIRVLHKKNGGVSNARNWGLNNAKGEWIVFVDSDDWIRDDYLQICIQQIHEFKLDAIQCGFVSIFANKQIPQIKPKTEVLNSEQFIQTSSFNVSVWGGAYKRSIIEKYHLRFQKELKLAEDQIFVLSFLKHVKRIKYLDEPMYYYLQRLDSAVHTSKSADILRSCDALMKFSKEWTSSKLYIDSMIILFIIDMVKNNDVPYKVLKDIYKKQNINELENDFIKQKIFPKLANINFYLACLITSLYLKIGFLRKKP